MTNISPFGSFSDRHWTHYSSQSLSSPFLLPQSLPLKLKHAQLVCVYSFFSPVDDEALQRAVVPERRGGVRGEGGGGHQASAVVQYLWSVAAEPEGTRALCCTSSRSMKYSIGRCTAVLDGGEGFIVLCWGPAPSSPPPSVSWIVEVWIVLRTIHSLCHTRWMCWCNSVTRHSGHMTFFSCFFGEFFLIRCEVKGQGCRMCTDCKALWGGFVICDIGRYKINWI